LIVQAKDQLQAGVEIEQARDRETISGLVGSDCGLRLGRIEAISGSKVKSKLLQMRLRDLDVASMDDV
jgi:hypothetical protein